MAVTITRSVWIDDDGTGQTGTVINQALHTTLYNEIDTALAKVAQLTGGNTFTGNQTITGLLAVAGTGTHVITGPGPTTLQVVASAAGSANYSQLQLGTDATSGLVGLQAFSSTFASSAFNFASGLTVSNIGSGGLSILLTHASAALRVYTNSLERLRVQPAGDVLIGAASFPFAVGVGIAADTAVRPPLLIQNSGAVNTGNLVTFINNAVGICGSIQQTNATTIAYVTTSDGRLKDDEGAATDLTALRGIVVHDFTWKADGVRDRGIFAQDAHALYPRAVVAGSDERTDRGDLARPWGTDYSKFVPDLIVGFQQHDAAIAELRAALAAAKG